MLPSPTRRAADGSRREFRRQMGMARCRLSSAMGLLALTVAGQAQRSSSREPATMETREPSCARLVLRTPA